MRIQLMMPKTKIKQVCLWLLVGIMVFYFLECPLQKICGIPCPGCNMTTALYYVLQGNFKTALYYHPLVFVLIVFAIIEGILYVKYKNFTNKMSKGIVYIFIVLLLIVYMIRMFTIFPSYPMAYVEDNFLRKIFTLFF